MSKRKYNLLGIAYAALYGAFTLPAWQEYEGIFLLITMPFLWWLISKIVSPHEIKNAR